MAVEPRLCRAAAFALVAAASACAPVPALTFIDGGGGEDATIAPPSDGGSEGGDSADAVASIDATLPDATPPIPDSGEDTAIPEAGADAADANESDALACLPPNAPGDAGCCYGVLPCVGLGCDYCTACIKQACHANQFCCAQLNGQGVYTGVQCSANGKNCP